MLAVAAGAIATGAIATRAAAGVRGLTLLVAFAFTFTVSVSAGTILAATSRVLVFVALALALAFLAATRAARAGCALLGDRFLFLAHAVIEHRERFIEATIDLCAAILAGHRTAARTLLTGARAARGLPRPAACSTRPGTGLARGAVAALTTRTTARGSLGCTVATSTG